MVSVYAIELVSYELLFIASFSNYNRTSYYITFDLFEEWVSLKLKKCIMTG